MITKIAGLHVGALAVDGGMRPLAFQDETQRRLAVPVCRRDLPRHHELYAGIERRRHLRLTTQTGILENQNALLGFLRRD